MSIYIGLRREGTDYIFPDTEKILSLTKSSPYGELGPYCLKIDGKIFENVWQFAKIYRTVPEVNVREHRYSSNFWSWPAEMHLDGEKKYSNITKEYWNWRNTGMNCSFPVRYPVGYNTRHKCLAHVWKGKFLDYITARKKIYLFHYIQEVIKEEKFLKLVKKIENGQDITIVEVDGPKGELEYYQEKYNVNDDFISNFVMSGTEENLKIMLNDEKYPFGHGYCLAYALLLYQEGKLNRVE